MSCSTFHEDLKYAASAKGQSKDMSTQLRTHTLVGHDKQYVCSSIGVQTYSSRELSQSGACGSNDLLVGYVDINFSLMSVTESYVTQRKLLSLFCMSMMNEELWAVAVMPARYSCGAS